MSGLGLVHCSVTSRQSWSSPSFSNSLKIGNKVEGLSILHLFTVTFSAAKIICSYLIILAGVKCLVFSFVIKISTAWGTKTVTGYPMAIPEVCCILTPTAATAFRHPGKADATGSMVAEKYAIGF